MWYNYEVLKLHNLEAIMTWITALVLCFVLWSTYMVPGNFAEKIHGVSVNMFFETAAFVAVTIFLGGRIAENLDRKSTRLNSSHSAKSRMPSSA